MSKERGKMTDTFKRFGVGAVLLFIFCFLGMTGYSQETTDVGQMESINEIETYTQYMPESSVEAMEGHVAILKSGGEYSHEFKILDKIPLDAAFRFDYINIDENISIELPVSLMETGVDLDVRFPVFFVDDVYAGVGISPSFMCDSESFGEESFIIPTRFLAIYAPSEKLIIAGGVEFFADVKDDIRAVGGVIYRPNEKWTFDLASDRPNIVYTINENWDVFAEGTYTWDEKYIVKKGDDTDVVLEYKETTVGGGVAFKIKKFLLVSFSMGGVFDRSLKYSEAGGKADIDKGYYLQGRGILNF